MSWIDTLIPRPMRRKTPAGGASAAPAPAMAPAARENRGAKKAPAKLFPRFKSTALDQLDPRVSDPFAKVRMSLRTAFTPSLPVTDQRMFAGRTQVLTGLIEAIEEQRLHTVL